MVQLSLGFVGSLDEWKCVCKEDPRTLFATLLSPKECGQCFLISKGVKETNSYPSIVGGGRLGHVFIGFDSCFEFAQKCPTLNIAFQVKPWKSCAHQLTCC